VSGINECAQDRPVAGEQATVSSDLASQLIEASSAEAFLAGQPTKPDWRTVATLKSEVDRLAWCDLNVAGRLADRATALADLIGDSVSRAFADASRARVLHGLGRHSESNGLYEKAAKAMRSARLRREAAIVQKQQLAPLMHLGRYDYALQTGRMARRALAGKEPLEYAQLEVNIGNIYYRLDRYNKALSHYERARELLVGLGDDATLATLDYNRSNILSETDRHQEALELLEASASKFEKAGRLLQASQARFNIAYLEFCRGNYNTALDRYYKLRDRLAQLGSTGLVAFCNLDLAELLLELNAFDEASETASRAGIVFEELEMPSDLARSVRAHGLAAMGLGQFEETRSDFLRARDVFAAVGNRVQTAITDSYLAELAGRQGDPDEMVRRARSSLRTFSRERLPTRNAYSRLLLARAAYQAGDWSRALHAARSALDLVDGLPAFSVAYQCQHLIGQIERGRNRTDRALHSFLGSVEAIEKMRVGVAADEFKATFLKDKIRVYEDAITACLDSGRRALVPKAFTLVESSKSRALADLLSRYVGSSGANTSRKRKNWRPDLRARLQELIEDMNWYGSQAVKEADAGELRAASQCRTTMLRRERQIARLFRQLEGQSLAVTDMQPSRPATAAEFCNSLARGETAIEYFITGDRISAFVATRAGLQVRRHITSRRRVEQMLSGLRFQIQKFSYGSDYVREHLGALNEAVESNLSGLHIELFAPLEDTIDCERLVIIPHGPLHYVPFHALNTGDRYLIDRFEISYAPSAAVFRLCRARSRRTRRIWRSRTARKSVRGRLVAVAVSDQEAPRIKEEVSALGRIFPDTVTILEAEATRENVFGVAPSARFLHIATHGYFKRDNPMFSYLRLADCRLNFYSLLDLELNAEMVTLSACHTGTNAVMPGDELHGLMRGFLCAGAPSMVTSLWNASDHATTELMTRLYENIRRGDSKRAALRKAQLAIKTSYKHPYYWAPFVLMGSPS
jgi:CHAT domain-containing protein/tetratricopeptide (TPR) repeat protein